MMHERSSAWLRVSERTRRAGARARSRMELDQRQRTRRDWLSRGWTATQLGSWRKQRALRVIKVKSRWVATSKLRNERVSQELIRLATPPPSAQEPKHSPHDKNQYCNRENAHRHKIANGIAKNVIRISRIEAVEPVKRGRQRG